ncbi:HutD/Ves family protein [Pectinatus haikarae]|uniref:Environmental stress-induced protein Ves n=1 Tax=Pectinatus haikarae TaxID=349096 RepID=A0ABT9Y477_9FIRM|nr:HutD family protein [Pectinatus haikarae]MDQ0202351.1 environmental stress-induced protein Ves [Pectinatus haikarae]
MFEKIFSAKEHQTTSWSGGSTTQLYISPNNSHYEARDFKLRLSSATVDADVSTFTELIGIDRILMSLDNEISLIHNNRKEIKLKPFTAHFFSGADKTISKGRCTDFNVMLKQNSYKNADLFTIADPHFSLEADNACYIYIADGAYEILCGQKSFTLHKGELLYLNNFPACKLKKIIDHSRAVICKINW